MIVERAYAWLLRAYPHRFRRHYGADITEAFRARYLRARDEGGSCRFLVRAVLDVLVNASLERRDAFRRWIVNPPLEVKPMFWQSTWMDVRYALRLFARAPAFTLLAVLALALGIGANSAIFTIVNAVLLKPLPYASPDRLVMIWSVNEAQGGQLSALSEGDLIDIRQASTTLARTGAFQANLVPINVTVDSNTTLARAVSLTPDTFALLGREALLGRTLRDGDRFTIVLSHGFWQRQFGGDASVVGRQVSVGSRAGTIVGVMPADFGFPYPSMLLAPISFTRIANVDVWVPATFGTSRPPNDSLRLNGLLGRLRPGVTVEQAAAEVDSIARRLARTYPDTNAGWTATAVSPQEQVVGPARSALLLLAAGVALVLLMTCVNVANLLLARSVRRQREMAVRTALGAGRARLVRQTFTESIILSLAGGLVAWLVVQWTIRLFVAVAPAEIPRLSEVGPDWRVVAFTGALAVLAGIATGLLPAMTASRLTVHGVLADAARGTTSRRGRRLRSMLVAAEVALALVLTMGAGLLVRSFISVLTVDPGFRTENLLTMQVHVPARHDTPDRRRDFYRQLFDRLQAVPGVLTVGGTTRLPLGGANSSTQVTIEGRDVSRGGLVSVGLRRALHDYFTAMGIPIVRGRQFDLRDGPNVPSVVLINETMARQVFPGEDPIGKRVRLAENAGVGQATIVGIVADVRHQGLETPPEAEIYIHYLQNPPTAPLLVLRTAGDAAAIVADVRAAAHGIEPTLRIFDFRTMADLRSESLSERQFLTWLATVFGAVALLLATVGVFGVMVLVVTERTQEMGIRLALGAAPGRVLGLVVGEGVRVAAIGVVAGLAASMVLTPLMASHLFGVGALDPLTLGSVPAILLVVAALACAIPARRAMSVDPVIALRND